MPKFFVEGSQIQGKTINITGSDVNHIANVLRLKKGDEIYIGNKDSGITYQADIIEISKEMVSCSIIAEADKSTESKVDVTIFQGIPKADKMEYIIQKSTEIGARGIVPVKMRRCIAKIEGKDEAKKIGRWQKIAEVAAKQSRRDIIPKIENVMNLNEIKEIVTNFDLFLVAYEEEEIATLKQQLMKLHVERGTKEIQPLSKMQLGDNTEDFKLKEKLKIGVLIGPEGGIDKQEVEELEQVGAKTVTLGNRILRTETAPIVILSNIIYEFE